MILPVPMLGFAPDLDPNILPQQPQGMWVDCDGWYPTERGFARVPSALGAYPALPERVTPFDDGSVYGAYVARFLNGDTRLIVGTKTKLYTGTGGAYTDASPLTDYQTQPFQRWRFCMFGDDCIAVNGRDVPQIITQSGTEFAALAGLPPIAKVCASVNAGGSAGFVFMLNLWSSIVGNTLKTNQWWCSAIGNDTSWTPDIATQSANGYLDETEGEITGARANGRNLIVYKKRATYLFEYLGGGTVWSPRLISTQAGALSHEAIIDLGDMHACMGFDGFYLVDAGGAPRLIDNCPLRKFVFKTDLNRNFEQYVWGHYDWSLQVATWYYPSNDVDPDGSDPQVCDTWVKWHPPSGKWTYGKTSIQALLTNDLPASPGLTYGELGTIFPTWGSADGIPWNSVTLSGSSDVVPAIVGDDHILATLTGQPAAGAFFKLGTFGDGQNYYIVRRMRPRFSAYPEDDGTYLESGERENLGDTETAGDTTYLDQDNGFFDVIANARFHDWRITVPEGECEIMGVDLDVIPAGER